MAEQLGKRGSSRARVQWGADGCNGQGNNLAGPAAAAQLGSREIPVLRTVKRPPRTTRSSSRSRSRRKFLLNGSPPGTDGQRSSGRFGTLSPQANIAIPRVPVFLFGQLYLGIEWECSHSGTCAYTFELALMHVVITISALVGVVLYYKIATRFRLSPRRWLRRVSSGTPHGLLCMGKFLSVSFRECQSA